MERLDDGRIALTEDEAQTIVDFIDRALDTDWDRYTEPILSFATILGKTANAESTRRCMRLWSSFRRWLLTSRVSMGTMTSLTQHSKERQLSTKAYKQAIETLMSHG